MLGFAKSFAKRLPYPVFLRVFVGWNWLVEMRGCRVAQRQMGIRMLSAEDLAAAKTSDTLFILGSGSSINRISGERWQAIAAHDTVGFNFSILHPFVPRMYFFEAIPEETWPEMFAAFARFASRRASDYERTLKVIMEPQHAAPRGHFAYPKEWAPSLRTVCTTAVAARDEHEFAYGIRFLRRKGIFEPGSPYLFKQLSTLSALLALASKMRYRKVVLCGVDLKDAMYFYQDPDLYPETKDLTFVPRQGKQPTFDPMPWRIPIDNVIAELNKQVLGPAGVRLFVENRSSALWPGIEEAPEALFAPPARQIAEALPR